MVTPMVRSRTRGWPYGSFGLSLQRVTLPLAVCTVKQRRSPLAGSASAAGISVLGAFAAGAGGGGGPIAPAGGRERGVTLGGGFAFPPTFRPNCPPFFP